MLWIVQICTCLQPSKGPFDHRSLEDIPRFSKFQAWLMGFITFNLIQLAHRLFTINSYVSWFFMAQIDCLIYSAISSNTYRDKWQSADLSFEVQFRCDVFFTWASSMLFMLSPHVGHFLGRQGQLCKAICFDAPVASVVRFAAGKTEATENYYGKLHSVHAYCSVSVRLLKHGQWFRKDVNGMDMNACTIEINWMYDFYCFVWLHVSVWLAKTRHVLQGKCG